MTESFLLFCQINTTAMCQLQLLDRLEQGGKALECGVMHNLFLISLQVQGVGVCVC